jgi:hypothetical protein
MQTSRRRSPATGASTAVIRCGFCRLPDRRILGKSFELLAGPSMLHDETMDRLELYYRLSIIWLALLILMAGFTLVLL